MTSHAHRPASPLQARCSGRRSRSRLSNNTNNHQPTPSSNISSHGTRHQEQPRSPRPPKMPVAHDDHWPLHDTAAGAALSAAVIASEWGPAVPLLPPPAAHPSQAEQQEPAVAGEAGVELGWEQEQQQQEEEVSLLGRVGRAVERLEAALFGIGGGVEQPQPQQGGAGGGGLRGVLAAAGGGRRRGGGNNGNTRAGAWMEARAAAVKEFVAAVGSAAATGEIERRVWDRLLLLPLSPQHGNGTPRPPAPVIRLLPPEGEARLVALCRLLVGGGDGDGDAAAAAAADAVPESVVRGLLRGAVLPHLRGLPGAASRPLVAALAGVARRRPRLLVQEALAPLLCPCGPSATEGAGAGLGAAVGSAQCELVTRLVKQGAVPPKHLDALLLGLCSRPATPTAPTPVAQAAAAEWTDPAPTAAVPPPMQAAAAEWTDLTLPVLTSVLLRAPPLGLGTVLALLERADGAVAAGGPLAGSLKLAALVKALVAKYPQQVQALRPLALRFLSRCERTLPPPLPATAAATAQSTAMGGRRNMGRSSSSSSSAASSSALALVAAALRPLVVGGGE